MNLLELQITTTTAVDRPWRDRRATCPRCQQKLSAMGVSDHYVCLSGHQFTARQLLVWPKE